MEKIKYLFLSILFFVLILLNCFVTKSASLKTINFSNICTKVYFNRNNFFSIENLNLKCDSSFSYINDGCLGKVSCKGFYKTKNDSIYLFTTKKSKKQFANQAKNKQTWLPRYINLDSVVLISKFNYVVFCNNKITKDTLFLHP